MSGYIGARNSDPCAKTSDLLYAAVVGAAVGAATGALLPTGWMGSSIVNGMASGFVGNSAGQLSIGGIGQYSFSQAVVQAGLGGITEGVGNSVALGTSLAVVRSGATSASAIQGGAFTGGVAGTVLSFGANVITPTELGGMTNEGGFCPRRC